MKSLGKAYHKYEQEILDNAIKGSTILKFSEEAISDCFDDIV